MNPLRVCALAATGLLLAACGSISPGAAAMVDGRAVSMSDLDETARVFCERTVKNAETQGVKAIDNADMRRQAAMILVMTQVADSIVQERDLKVPKPVDVSPDQFVDAFGADRAPEIAKVTSDVQALYDQFAVIGSDESSTTLTDENRSNLTQVGLQTVVAAFPDHDVRFSPRLGLNKSGEPNQDIGSLSVAPVDFDAPGPDELPGPLACRA